MKVLLSRFANCRGASGFEASRQEEWLREVRRSADHVWTDCYGNAAASVDGTGPRVVLTTHADEIGYQIRDIDERGFLLLDSIGRTDETVSKGQEVIVHTDNGSETGVVGQTPVQLRERDADGQYVDIGAVDEDAANERVSVGDPVTIDTEMNTVGESLVTGRMDNSVGLCVTAAVLDAIESASLPVTVVSTVQEEIGVRGARMFDLDLDPDVFLAVDTDFATDHPNVPGDARSPVSLADGPVLGRGMANHASVVSRLRDAADELGESVQLQSNPQFTGTHADALYTKYGGVPTAKIGIPCRYMHTPTEMIDMRDLESSVSILTSFLHSVAEDRPTFSIH